LEALLRQSRLGDRMVNKGFNFQMGMKKIDVAAIKAARRG
jgi:hypothetical protein